ncbi:MAG: hypothetical protein ACLP50_07275 [Solirubrobacteraceae bacterium]
MRTGVTEVHELPDAVIADILDLAPVDELLELNDARETGGMRRRGA